MKKNKRILEQIKENELLIKRQSERIEELRRQNAALEDDVKYYRDREGKITDAITCVKKQGEEYMAKIRIKYAIECERLDRFREKLNGFRTREELIKAYDDAFSMLKEWQNDLERGLSRGMGEEMDDYMEEKERLDDEPKLNYGAIVEKERTNWETAERITDEDLKELLDQL